MDNKEMRKEFEIWAKENYDLMNININQVEKMFELFEDRYNFIAVRGGYQVFKKLKEEASAEKTKPIWTWEDKRLKILPEVGSEIVRNITKSVYEVLKKNQEGFVVATTNEFGEITVGYYTKEEIVRSFSPYETLQQIYNRECQEYCSKALTELVQGKTGPFEIFQKLYKEIKPFKEDKKD